MPIFVDETIQTCGIIHARIIRQSLGTVADEAAKIQELGNTLYNPFSGYLLKKMK